MLAEIINETVDAHPSLTDVAVSNDVMHVCCLAADTTLVL